MANLSQLTLPVKDTITGIVTPTTFDLAGSDSKNFIGTRAEWETLTQAEKEEYDTMDIYGEYNDSPIDPVPTSGSTNPVASGGVYTAVQNVETNIAGIESSATASQAYTIGKYIIFGNVLYKVIASIAIGDTLTVGTNIQAAKIADEVSNHLTVNGTEFYFDSHDGVFGYNTSPNRGADTFNPFSSGSEVTYIGDISMQASNSWQTKSLAAYKDYERILIFYLFTWTKSNSPYFQNCTVKNIHIGNTGGESNPRQGLVEVTDIADNSNFIVFNGSYSILQVYTY